MKIRPGQHVPAGTLLIPSSPPLVRCLNEEYRGDYCDYCFNKANVVACSGCGCVFYCSDTCRHDDQAIHSQECQPLKNYAPKQLATFDQFVARTIITLRSGGRDEWVEVGEQKKRQFHHLITHTKEMKLNEEQRNEVTNGRALLASVFGEDFMPSYDDLFEIYGALAINCFFVMRDIYAMGYGLYLAVCALDHACRPNAQVHFDGVNACVRTEVDIPNFTWDKVRVSFLNLLEPRSVRQSMLRTRYHFECDCEACNDEDRLKMEDTIKCGNPECTYPVEVPVSAPEPDQCPSDPPVAVATAPSCPRCGYSSYPDTLLSDYQALIERLERALDLNELEFEMTEDVCYLLLEQQQQLMGLRKYRKKEEKSQQWWPQLHPLNLHRVRHADTAMQAALLVNNFELAIRIATSNLDGLKYYCGANSTTVGTILFKIGKLCLVQKRYKQAVQLLKEAEKILRITLGSDHRLLTEELLPLLSATKDLRTVLKDPLAPKHFRKAEKQWAAKEKAKINWLRWSFGFMIMGMAYLGVTGVK